jgi:hypothetical protein
MLDDAASTPPRPSAEFIKGLSEYRQGQFARAEARLERAVYLQTNNNTAKQAQVILDMARRQLGKPNEVPFPADREFSLTGGDWNEQMTTLLFAHEARGLVAK